MVMAKCNRGFLFNCGNMACTALQSSGRSLSKVTVTTSPLNNKLSSLNAIRLSSSTVDMRSDTVTAPTTRMLEAALAAPTGDDVLGEDPTVLELEAYVANMFRKPSGLYVPTGTMSNLVAVMAHCHTRASEIIVGANSHICVWEGGNAATLGGVHTRQLEECKISAELDENQIRDVFHKDNDDHYAETKALCLENTHNAMGGVTLSIEYMDKMGALCRELGIALHVDGARVCNAAVSLGKPVHEVCASADSVSVCLSKGLGAPLGSVLVGDTEFIRLAKRARKRCGGGMRQAGVVAAMGLYAVRNNYERLADDHDRAQRLANELQRHGFRIPREGKIDTNLVYFGLPQKATITKEEYCGKLDAQYGIKLAGGYSQGGELFRAVTHLDIDDSGIERAAAAMVDVAFG